MSVSGIAAETGIPRSTVGKLVKEMPTVSQERPPASAEPPPSVADRAGWLRAQLQHAETQAQGKGPSASAWAGHALKVRDKLDETEAEARRKLEAAGKATEPDPVALAMSILYALPQLARQIPRQLAVNIHAELAKVLGLVDDEDDNTKETR